MMKKKKTNNQGLTLIEVLISLVILAIISIGLYSLYTYTLKVINDNRARTGAVAIAEQRLEMIRNMPYNDVGTIGGIPSGTITASEEIDLNNFIYTATSYVRYIDDPFDGLLGEPGETLNADYKQVEVQVSWRSPFGTRSVDLSTIVAPRGIETVEGGGTLKISVFDADGQPVPLANVHIENNMVAPPISVDHQTGVSGILLLPGTPESIENYSVTVTKDGYSTEQTCPTKSGTPNPICPVSIANDTPTKPHLSVYEGELTEEGFTIDRVGTLNIYTISKGLADNWEISVEEIEDDKTGVALSMDTGNHLYFVWQDYRHGSAAKLYGQSYTLAKTQLWQDDVTISTPNNQVYPEIINDFADNLYVAWGDDRGGNQDIYIMKYDNDGLKAWEGDKKINTDAQNDDQIQATIDFNNDYAFVAWADNRGSDYDIYAQKIHPDGTYQWTPEVKLTTSLSQQYDPSIAADSTGNSYIVWTDERNDLGDIYARKVDSDGNLLWANDIIINSDASTDYQQYQARLAINSEENVFITWSDDRNDNFDIYAQKIDPDGNKLWPSDLRINSDTSGLEQNTPDIAIDSSDNVFYTWTDARNGDNDVFATKFDVNDVREWTSDQRINTDLGTGDQKNPKIVAYADGNIVVAWEDNREGAYAVQAATFAGPGSISTIADVPLHIYGTKRIGEDPIILKYDQELSTDFNGVLNLTPAEWDGYFLEPTIESGYSLIESSPTQPVDLQPGVTTDVLLTIK